MTAVQDLTLINRVEMAEMLLGLILVWLVIAVCVLISINSKLAAGKMEEPKA